ncbi:GntR family transcriptional regulator, transcriptional repressor for pyruvate dehydrogenase complex [Mameliella alba]|uniref:FadR/GntR family transcriptional regulator n=1 Tax=Mameliella alba TaxID=561184 RepID=UPI00087FFD42|nr:FadR/GntR family transcriptional regulator [Mameliella alba]OWV47602.1 FadR family transcriptional regulator [Mameliella alba]PTR38478.1 GntR family transcriptional repressor for pyruvate dehydrogenase complex [Mameliella alba]GGF59705.1 GntR family transcriptional regulator [Mameliella alba]SDC86031.1 GntR family transcriptional regulator, transcriptional repressor for pyruvate dehydrogenase complex [Mameliella alba]
MADKTTRTKRKSLSEDVFDKLVRSIKSGAYGENERLPTENDLAAEFQVSRPTIREALRKLREQGFIYSRRGAGSFVRQSGLREPLGFGNLQSIADLERCYEFRLTLEPEAAASAAERHDAAGLAAIEAALKLMRDATEQSRHREDADFAFHCAIARASGNQYFATAMEALEEHIAVGMQFHGISLKASNNGLAAVYAEHREIYEAIRDRRAGDARDLMRAHLQGSRDRLFTGQPQRGEAG